MKQQSSHLRKLEEEERERRMEFIPKETEFKLENRKIDEDTKKMLEDLKLTNVLG